MGGALKLIAFPTVTSTARVLSYGKCVEEHTVPGFRVIERGSISKLGWVGRLFYKELFIYRFPAFRMSVSCGPGR